MTHAHSHTHDYADRTHPEYVVLDIGNEFGALILHADAAMHGVEVEISRAGEERTGAHKQILERTVDGRPAFTAVYDKLPEGSYTLWLDDRPEYEGLTVTAGEVSEVHWTA